MTELHGKDDLIEKQYCCIHVFIHEKTLEVALVRAKESINILFH